MRVFGSPPEEGEATPRRAAYAVIAAPSGCVAAVQTGLGLFLPGGGAEGEETPQQTVRRECFEEIGREVTFSGLIGEALQYFTVEGASYRMQAVFLSAEFVDGPPSPCEHELRWAQERDAVRFFHQSHAWAAGFLAEHPRSR